MGRKSRGKVKGTQVEGGDEGRTEVRFQYEHAERILDGYAAQQSKSFQRAYRKFKFMISAYAYVDYARVEKWRASAEGEGNPGRRIHAVLSDWALWLSYAWEDAQMAVVGHGEGAITGALLQVWVNVKDHDEFAQALRDAFAAAEKATLKEVPRRYLVSYRLKPVRLPEEGFNLEVILPTRGVVLREWAFDQGQDPDELEEEWYWIELADRDGAGVVGEDEWRAAVEGLGKESRVPVVAARPQLKLVVSDDEGGA